MAPNCQRQVEHELDIRSIHLCSTVDKVGLKFFKAFQWLDTTHPIKLREWCCLNVFVVFVQIWLLASLIPTDNTIIAFVTDTSKTLPTVNDCQEGMNKLRARSHSHLWVQRVYVETRLKEPSCKEDLAELSNSHYKRACKVMNGWFGQRFCDSSPDPSSILQISWRIKTREVIASTNCSIIRKLNRRERRIFRFYKRKMASNRNAGNVGEVSKMRC